MESFWSSSSRNLSGSNLMFLKQFLIYLPKETYLQQHFYPILPIFAFSIYMLLISFRLKKKKKKSKNIQTDTQKHTALKLFMHHSASFAWFETQFILWYNLPKGWRWLVTIPKQLLERQHIIPINTTQHTQLTCPSTSSQHNTHGPPVPPHQPNTTHTAHLSLHIIPTQHTSHLSLHIIPTQHIQPTCPSTSFQHNTYSPPVPPHHSNTTHTAHLSLHIIPTQHIQPTCPSTSFQHNTYSPPVPLQSVAPGNPCARGQPPGLHCVSLDAPQCWSQGRDPPWSGQL